jgi:hypothetical protein
MVAVRSSVRSNQSDPREITLRYLAGLTVLCLFWPNSFGASDDSLPSLALKTNRQAGASLYRIRDLSRTYREHEAARKEELLGKLAEALQELEGFRQQVGDVATAMMEDFRHRFTDLVRIEQPGWWIAPTDQPLRDEIPENIEISYGDESVVIHKSGGRETYHACLATPLEEGRCLVIRFSLTVRGGGGTPVPYFGVRDEKGAGSVLFLFGSGPDPGKVFEIMIDNNDGAYTALYDGRLKTMDISSFALKDFDSPGYIFFHMNDVSEVVIHDILMGDSSGY